MEASFRVVLPPPPTAAGQQKNGKLAMKARVHEWLDERHIVDSVGKNFINALTDVLWCIDGHDFGSSCVHTQPFIVKLMDEVIPLDASSQNNYKVFCKPCKLC